ncbi:MAG: hypothetical protein AB7D35_11400 [Bacteroidales bacterium]
MKKILSNQKGVTLIETLAASVIIILLLFTVMGALMFGQGVIVGSDEKNNAAATAQEIIDDLMASLSGGASYDGNASDTDSGFINPGDPGYTTEQYYIESEVIKVDLYPESTDNETIEKNAYKIHVRVYYNQDQSYVELSAFNKDGGVWK